MFKLCPYTCTCINITCFSHFCRILNLMGRRNTNHSMILPFTTWFTLYVHVHWLVCILSVDIFFIVFENSNVYNCNSYTCLSISVGRRKIYMHTHNADKVAICLKIHANDWRLFDTSSPHPTTPQLSRLPWKHIFECFKLSGRKY